MSQNKLRTTTERRSVPATLNRFVDFVERHRYGPISTAGATTGAIIGAGWTLWQALGGTGSIVVFLVLVTLGIFCGSLVHSYLLQRSLARLQRIAQRAQISEVREQFGNILPRLEQDTAREIQELMTGYELEIVELRNELSRRKVKDIPGRGEPIDAGPFMMGTSNGLADEGPPHQVFVSAFWIDTYPVTNQQYVDFVNDPENVLWLPESVSERYGIPYYLVEWQGSVPPPGKWDHPVVWVGWFAAAAFCNWRSRQENREEVYRFLAPTSVESDFSRSGWRLPTEAEWEKAARCGTDSEFPVGGGRLAPNLANYGGHHRGTTPVGLFPPNGFGLFDMLGNVKEWCHDWYSPTTYKDRATERTRDPAGPTTGELKVFRGGGWLDRAEWVGACKRGKIPPRNTNPDFGFRCVRRP